MKPVIVVADKKFQKFSRQLVGLVSCQDMGVNIVPMSLKVFEDNESSIDQKNYIIFVGENEISNYLKNNYIEKYNNFGISYGWKGTRCLISVSGNKLSREEYNMFYDYCSREGINIEKLNYGDYNDDNIKKMKGFDNWAKNIPIINTIVEKYDNSIACLLSYNKVFEQQYKVGIDIFYKNSFLEFVQ